MLIDGNGKKVEEKELKGKKIVFFGASTRTPKAISELQIEEDVIFLVDSDDNKVGKTLAGYKICPVDELCRHQNYIVISVLVSRYREILDILKKKGIENCLFYYLELFDIAGIIKSNNEIIKKSKEIKYIHIFSNDKFIISFYQMLEQRFKIHEHLFILDYQMEVDFADVFGFVMKKNELYHNILIFDDVHGIAKENKQLVPETLKCNKIFYFDSFQEICHKAEKIFLHSAFWRNEIKKFLYCLIKKFSKKMVWICFGGDVYLEKDSFEVSQILKKITLCYASQGVINEIKSNYGLLAKPVKGLYEYIPNSVLQSGNNKKSGITNILLGHSAAEYGNHIWGLELLQKYKNQDIKIYCPLSYGSVGYRDSVIKFGKEMYGEKFIPLTEFIEHSEYYKFLQSINVAVFPMTRLAAETTLIILTAMSIKIYAGYEMVKKLKYEDIEAEDILKINKQSFEEFIDFSKTEFNINGINELNNSVVSTWAELFAR